MANSFYTRATHQEFQYCFSSSLSQTVAKLGKISREEVRLIATAWYTYNICWSLLKYFYGKTPGGVYQIYVYALQYCSMHNNNNNKERRMLLFQMHHMVSFMRSQLSIARSLAHSICMNLLVFQNRLRWRFNSIVNENNIVTCIVK